MTWTVASTSAVDEWFLSLDSETATQVSAALRLLAQEGPALGRPFVDTITGSKIRNLKELRPGSAGRSEIRVLFAFDPKRQAVLLVGGDKAGDWKRWYVKAIKQAEKAYAEWLKESD